MVDTLSPPDITVSTTEAPLPELTPTQQELLSWAQSLPTSHTDKQTILDISAHKGEDANFLAQLGYTTISQDLNINPLKTASGKRAVARSTQLPHKANSIQGIIFKDTLAFIPHNQRSALFAEMYRVLEPGGSAWLLSQQNEDHRIVHPIPNSIGVERDSSHGQASPDLWLTDKIHAALVEDKAHSKDIIVEHITTPDQTKKLASQIGLKITYSHSYDSRSPLAQDNRWVNKQGFIFVLQKPYLTNPSD